MKQRPNLIQLAKEVYEANKAKGFHASPISNDTLLMLVITEVSEAIEADRKGRRTNPFDLAWAESTADYCHLFEEHFPTKIKDTVEDELADAVIRLLDLAGYRNIPTLTPKALGWYNKALCGTFCENIFHLTRSFIRTSDLRIIIPMLIRGIEDLCKQMSIDLWYHVELKLEYNKTRPQRHGKAY